MEFIVDTIDKDKIYKVAYLLGGEIVNKNESLVIVNYEDDESLRERLEDILDDVFTIEVRRTGGYNSLSKSAIKQELGLKNKDIAEFFDMSEMGFANSSAKDRYLTALSRFYDFVKAGGQKRKEKD